MDFDTLCADLEDLLINNVHNYDKYGDKILKLLLEKIVLTENEYLFRLPCKSTYNTLCSVIKEFCNDNNESYIKHYLQAVTEGKFDEYLVVKHPGDTEIDTKLINILHKYDLNNLSSYFANTTGMNLGQLQLINFVSKKQLRDKLKVFKKEPIYSWLYDLVVTHCKQIIGDAKPVVRVTSPDFCLADPWPWLHLDDGFF